ncbi:probable protein phosphatase 2C 68 [Cucurbita pepo subsp. pepo]|uniref:protein-serine/threonine phosphatase n=1 Tax=Cucurbita moschata TaxID=3662 RepID=A0A6J1FJA1_CUCMO|nr:probable protein phosphatase 2C 68 [Cucurbita moschata]XP_023547298.1 probable protein phosphatase 2C 68 [Cucurbita pepo subsp. pepo]
MFSWLARMASACWKPVRRYARMNKDDDEDCSLEDSLLWSRELEKHSYGEFSFAVVQANEVIEDNSQVEAGRDATFVGVYDGHGGADASRFICDHLFRNLMRLAQEHGTITEDTVRNAFSATEEGFLTLVRRSWGIKPTIAAMGSCCLVGVIWRGTLFIGNVGDSRAVIGSLGKANKIVAEQLTKDHNASIEEVRQELRSLHPDDSHIVVMKHGVWRIKGIIQVSRSIGDAYLKRSEFSLDPSFPRFHLAEPLRRPVLTAEPSLSTRVLQPHDKFLIFASDGLWEQLSNQQAVEIVYKNPRAGIAKRLVKTALTEAARKREMRYDDLKKLEKGIRRFFHDDITVVVIFLDNELQGKKAHVPELSIRGFTDTVGPSNFNVLQGIDENGRSVG